ncbi:MAG: serine/threonine-protein kinase, partial [Polyangiaceae bacterium]
MRKVPEDAERGASPDGADEVSAGHEHTVSALTKRADSRRGGDAWGAVSRSRQRVEPTGDGSLAHGQLVDHFKVIQLLGRGGMGEVYLARDTKLGRKVALKLVQPAALGGEQDVERFLFEARTTAKFSHPNIVTVYTVGEHEGLPYLALEYLRGQTLEERMAEQCFSPREAARIGVAIGEALVEAHRHHVLHRDLKPDNILMPPDGRLRVVDFGLARQVEAAAPRSVQAPPSRSARVDEATDFDRFQTDETVKGTPMYMAPEQWAAAKLDAAVDVWALGLIVYELTSGRHPFEDCDNPALVRAVIGSKPVPPMEGSDALPRPLVDLIERCVAKMPAERPKAVEVVAELKAFLQYDVRRLPEGQSPFRGLQPFTERDAQLFFGRDVEIDRFIERLRQQAVLPVVGPSGAGKSSLVRAGVIARLRESERWQIVRMRPGRRPFETLAARLRQAASGYGLSDARVSNSENSRPQPRSLLDEHNETEKLAKSLAASPWRLSRDLAQLAEQHDAKVLLFVDQLEELCTLVKDVATRRRFMDALCSAIHDAELPLRVVFTVRDDFLARLALSETAREALSYVTVCRPP